MGWLWGQTKKRGGSPLRVAMYSRQGCHLCDDAWKLLEEMQSCYGFDLEAIDVDSQADLVQHYGERVPVIVVNGEERFWGKINRVLLERLFRARGEK